MSWSDLSQKEQLFYFGVFSVEDMETVNTDFVDAMDSPRPFFSQDLSLKMVLPKF